MSNQTKTINAYVLIIGLQCPSLAHDVAKIGKLYHSGWATYDSVLAELKSIKKRYTVR